MQKDEKLLNKSFWWKVRPSLEWILINYFSKYISRTFIKMLPGKFVSFPLRGSLRTQYSDIHLFDINCKYIIPLHKKNVPKMM